MTVPILFYAHDGPADAALLARARDNTPEHEALLWRPDRGVGGPPGARGRIQAVYGAFHRLGLFANGDYSALVLSRQGQAPDHVSSVFPRFFRFPFMADDDLQIGATSTEPAMRGRGLAQRAILEIVAALGRPGRTFWYLTEADNLASRRTVEKAGFTFAGEGVKEPRLGLRVLGSYRISRPAAASSSPGQGR